MGLTVGLCLAIRLVISCVATVDLAILSTLRLAVSTRPDVFGVWLTTGRLLRITGC